MKQYDLFAALIFFNNWSPFAKARTQPHALNVSVLNWNRTTTLRRWKALVHSPTSDGRHSHSRNPCESLFTMEIPKLEESRNGCLWCLVCQVKTESMETFQAHLRTKPHLKSFTLRKIGHVSYYGCVACSLEFESTVLFEKHVRSIRHRERVYDKNLSHKSAGVPNRGDKELVYRCNTCKVGTSKK